MNSFLIYLIQVSCCFSVLYTAYYLLLRKLTFHKINRILLLLLLPISLCFPFLNHIEIPITNRAILTPDFEEFLELNTIVNEGVQVKKEYQTKDLDPILLLPLINGFGVFICLLRYYYQLYNYID